MSPSPWGKICSQGTSALRQGTRCSRWAKLSRSRPVCHRSRAIRSQPSCTPHFWTPTAASVRARCPRDPHRVRHNPATLVGAMLLADRGVRAGFSTQFNLGLDLRPRASKRTVHEETQDRRARGCRPPTHRPGYTKADVWRSGAPGDDRVLVNPLVYRPSNSAHRKAAADPRREASPVLRPGGGAAQLASLLDG